MSQLKLIRFQRKIITELVQESPNGDGLVIVAKGLGLQHLITTFVALHADPKVLVFLLNTSPSECDWLKNDSETVGKSVYFSQINNEVNANARWASASIVDNT
jgi:hypothetical protein